MCRKLVGFYIVLAFLYLYSCYCSQQTPDRFETCRKDTCMNGGTCRLNNGNIKCFCQRGYTGQYCDIIPNNCSGQPCLFGGVCKENKNGFNCDCLPGTTGDRCEVFIGECYKRPCKNGTCSPAPTASGYTCECMAGLTGTNCEYDINECFSSPCLYGECVDLINGYLCTCNSGHTGTNCDIVSDKSRCNPTVCKFGTCAINESGSYCQCFPGFAGGSCEVNINECESSPCSYGTCEDHVNMYVCKCSTGYEGKHCDIPTINVCRSNPCLNGYCSIIEDGYKCVCFEGFTGDYCDTADVPCDDKRDCGVGHCLVNGSDYTCNCPDGYTGSHCEKRFFHCESKTFLHKLKYRLSMNSTTSSFKTHTVKDILCVCELGYKENPCIETDVFLPSDFHRTATFCSRYNVFNNSSLCVTTDDGQGYKCTCKGNFTAIRCNQTLAPLASGWHTVVTQPLHRHVLNEYDVKTMNTDKTTRRIYTDMLYGQHHTSTSTLKSATIGGLSERPHSTVPMPHSVKSNIQAILSSTTGETVTDIMTVSTRNKAIKPTKMSDIITNYDKFLTRATHGSPTVITQTFMRTVLDNWNTITETLPSSYTPSSSTVNTKTVDEDGHVISVDSILIGALAVLLLGVMIVALVLFHKQSRSGTVYISPPVENCKTKPNDSTMVKKRLSSRDIYTELKRGRYFEPSYTPRKQGKHFKSRRGFSSSPSLSSPDCPRSSSSSPHMNNYEPMETLSHVIMSTSQSEDSSETINEDSKSRRQRKSALTNSTARRQQQAVPNPFFRQTDGTVGINLHGHSLKPEEFQKSLDQLMLGGNVGPLRKYRNRKDTYRIQGAEFGKSEV